MKWLIQKVWPLGLAVVLVVLINTGTLSLLNTAGTILTASLAIVTLTARSVRQKSRKVFDAGDYKTNRSADVTSENRVPPAVLRPGILTLNELGFCRLGEETTVTADGKELGCEWIFISADRQVVAGLLPDRMRVGGFLAGFQTIFPDYAWLLTFYPTGFPRDITITRPDFRFRHNHSSVQDAYNSHRAELSDFAQQHGTPALLPTMADYLAFAPIFRERYMGLILQWPLRLTMLSSHVYSGFTMLFLIGTLLSGIAPALAILIFVLGFSALGLYQSYMVPAHPHAARLYRVAIALALLLLPLCYVWHGVVLAHNLLLALLMSTFHRYIPASARTLTAEIQAGREDINWQIERPRIDDLPDEI